MKSRPALLLAMLLSLPLAATAQPPGPGPDGPPPGEFHPPSPERMTEHLSKELGLDEQQTTKLRALNERHHAEMKRLRAEHEKALRELLTPAQWTRFEQLKKEMRGRHRRGAGEHTPEPA